MQSLLLLMAFLSPWVEAENIIGGHMARPHSHPYMAFLRVIIPERKGMCGGFLVREDIVLTAAHCRGRSMNVTLGAHNISREERTQQVFGVEKAIPHPDYDPKKIGFNDIMLLKLTRKANLKTAVTLLRLPEETTTVHPGQVCSVAGWGLLIPMTEQPTTKLAIRANTLREVVMTVQKDKVCKMIYPYTYEKTMHLCVGDGRLNKATYEGDSGGPLVCNNVAQGIVCCGKKDGKPPQIFTKISTFLPWIKETMRRL